MILLSCDLQQGIMYYAFTAREAHEGYCVLFYSFKVKTAS